MSAFTTHFSTAALAATGLLALTAATASAQITIQYQKQPPAPVAVGNNLLIRALLNSHSAEKRESAARQLGHTGDPNVIPALSRAAVSDPEPRVRREATEAVQRIRRHTGGGVAVQQLPIVNGTFAPQVQQVPDAKPALELVSSWYQRFLKRNGDFNSMNGWATVLQRGDPEENVLAGIIGGDEYWDLHGGRPWEFIKGLYQDVLNRPGNAQEVKSWLSRFEANNGNREAVAREFLQASQKELHGQPWYYQR